MLRELNVVLASNTSVGNICPWKERLSFNSACTEIHLTTLFIIFSWWSHPIYSIIEERGAQLIILARKISEVLRGAEQRSSVDTALCKVSRHQGTCSMVHSIGNVPVLPVEKKEVGQHLLEQLPQGRD